MWQRYFCGTHRKNREKAHIYREFYIQSNLAVEHGK